jgi:hypothetical protein
MWIIMPDSKNLEYIKPTIIKLKTWDELSDEIIVERKALWVKMANV